MLRGVLQRDLPRRDIADNAEPVSNEAKRPKFRAAPRDRERLYYRPILEALVELGGSAPVTLVLDRVFSKIRNQLDEHDLEPIESAPKMPRWRKAAQWARLEMVKEGLLRGNSPRNVWQITESGVQYLHRTAGR